jgi:DNA-binding MarR family transcriptional regulator
VNESDVNPGTVATLEQLVAAAFRVRRAIGRRTGLSEVELGTLELLTQSPSSPGELAKVFEVSTAASTGIVDRLEKRGHVERRPHETDRRRTEVHLTASGQRELDAQIQPSVDALVELDAGLSEEERAIVDRFLRDAIAAFALVADDD